MREPDEFVYEQLLPNERFESFRQNDSDVRQTEEVQRQSQSPAVESQSESVTEHSPTSAFRRNQNEEAKVYYEPDYGRGMVCRGTYSF